MAEISSNTLIANNGGDGVRFVFHNLFESAKDTFCDIPLLGREQRYPIKLIQSVSRKRGMTQPCKKVTLFATNGCMCN